MKVGHSVRFAVDAWERGEYESAMLHACNAVDGTGAKRYPKKGAGDRFTSVLRDSYAILGAWAAPGLNVVDTRWPVDVRHKPKTSDGRPDLADVIYSIHRCTQGHGDELPDGFELTPASAPDPVSGLTAGLLSIENGKVALPQLTIWGLIMVAVTAPENADQPIPLSYFVWWMGRQYNLQALRGRADEWANMIRAYSMPSVTMDFGDWARAPRR